MVPGEIRARIPFDTSRRLGTRIPLVSIRKYTQIYQLLYFCHWQELEGYDIISHVDKTRAYGFRAFWDSKLGENMGH